MIFCWNKATGLGWRRVYLRHPPSPLIVKRRTKITTTPAQKNVNNENEIPYSLMFVWSVWYHLVGPVWTTRMKEMQKRKKKYKNLQFVQSWASIKRMTMISWWLGFDGQYTNCILKPAIIVRFRIFWMYFAQKDDHTQYSMLKIMKTISYCHCKIKLKAIPFPISLCCTSENKMPFTHSRLFV